MKMEQTECSEMSAYKIQNDGESPKRYNTKLTINILRCTVSKTSKNKGNSVDTYSLFSFMLYFTSFYFTLISLYLFNSRFYSQTLYENKAR